MESKAGREAYFTAEHASLVAVELRFPHAAVMAPTGHTRSVFIVRGEKGNDAIGRIARFSSTIVRLDRGLASVTIGTGD